jgi:hypothetical protein
MSVEARVEREAMLTVTWPSSDQSARMFSSSQIYDISKFDRFIVKRAECTYIVR